MKFKKIKSLLYGMFLLLVATTSNSVSSLNELNQNVDLTNANNNAAKEAALPVNVYNQIIPSYTAYIGSSPKISVHNNLAPVYQGPELKQSTIWNSWFWSNNEVSSQYGNKAIAQDDWYWLYGATSNSGYVTTMKLYTGNNQQVFIVVTPAPTPTQNGFPGTIGDNLNDYIISVAVFNKNTVFHEGEGPLLQAPIWTSSERIHISGNTSDNYGFTFEDQRNFTHLSFSNSTQPNNKIWDINI